MKPLLLTALCAAFVVPPLAQAATQGETPMSIPQASMDDVRAVAPALERYTVESLQGDVWKRPGLSARDRSLATVATLVASNQTAELPRYLNLALDSGVTPAEISETITHLAFYAGWSRA